MEEDHHTVAVNYLNIFKPEHWSLLGVWKFINYNKTNQQWGVEKYDSWPSLVDWTVGCISKWKTRPDSLCAVLFVCCAPRGF